MSKTVFSEIKKEVKFASLILNNLENYCETFNLTGLINKDDINVYIKHFDFYGDIEFKAWIFDFKDLLEYVSGYIYFNEYVTYKNLKYRCNYNMKISHEIDKYNDLFITIEIKEDRIYL